MLFLDSLDELGVCHDVHLLAGEGHGEDGDTGLLAELDIVIEFAAREPNQVADDGD